VALQAIPAQWRSGGRGDPGVQSGFSLSGGQDSPGPACVGAMLWRFKALPVPLCARRETRGFGKTGAILTNLVSCHQTVDQAAGFDPAGFGKAYARLVSVEDAVAASPATE